MAVGSNSTMLSLQVQGVQCLELVSTATLLQLAAVLADAIGISPTAEHRFEDSSLAIDYLSLTDLSRHDGWLTRVTHGVFLAHPHPHQPLAKDASLAFPIAQVRSQQLWSLGLAFATPTLLFHHPALTLPIEISLLSSRSATPDDLNPQPTLERCKLCTFTGCPADCGAVSDTPCCDFCLRSTHPGWAGRMSPAFAAQITALARETTEYIHREYKIFFHASRAGLPFSCQWTESTGEPCVFCTEGFL